jgi:hypothetical protein
MSGTIMCFQEVGFLSLNLLNYLPILIINSRPPRSAQALVTRHVGVERAFHSSGVD